MSRLQGFLVSLYVLGIIGTWIYLTFFDGYQWTLGNAFLAHSVNLFLSAMWPLYWLMLRWLPNLT